MFNNEQNSRNWNWDDLRTVLAVADSGSLSGAARLLGSSHPTVFRKIRKFEKRLNSELFEKSATGYLPTNAGEIVIETARRLAAEVDELNHQLGLGSPPMSGTLRLTCSDTVYTYLLAPMLSDFRQRYPDVILDVLVSNEMINLLHQDIDVAIRSARRSEQSLHGVKLADVNIAAHAHMDHPVFKQHPLRLTAHDWVGYDENLMMTGLARFLRDHELERCVVFRANSLTVACEAIRNNIGLGLMPSYVAAVVPEVRRVPLAYAQIISELWVVSTRAQQKKPLIRTFFAFLEEQFAPLQELISAGVVNLPEPVPDKLIGPILG